LPTKQAQSFFFHELKKCRAGPDEWKVWSESNKALFSRPNRELPLLHSDTL
jgi:hypothetical protein